MPLSLCVCGKTSDVIPFLLAATASPSNLDISGGIITKQEPRIVFAGVTSAMPFPLPFRLNSERGKQKLEAGSFTLNISLKKQNKHFINNGNNTTASVSNDELFFSAVFCSRSTGSKGKEEWKTTKRTAFRFGCSLEN